MRWHGPEILQSHRQGIPEIPHPNGANRRQFTRGTGWKNDICVSHDQSSRTQMSEGRQAVIVAKLTAVTSSRDLQSRFLYHARCPALSCGPPTIWCLSGRLRTTGGSVGTTRQGQAISLSQAWRKVVFFGRLVALLRILAASLAGVNRMRWRNFLVANATCAVLWAAVSGLGGYSFGKLLFELHAILADIVSANGAGDVFRRQLRDPPLLPPDGGGRGAGAARAATGTGWHERRLMSSLGRALMQRSGQALRCLNAPFCVSARRWQVHHELHR